MVGNVEWQMVFLASIDYWVYGTKAQSMGPGDPHNNYVYLCLYEIIHCAKALFVMLNGGQHVTEACS